MDAEAQDGMDASAEGLVQLAARMVDGREGGAAAPRILDMGCDAEATREALAALGPVTAAEGDLCALAFEDAFDLAFSCGVFHQVPDQLGLLRSVNRALAPGGALVAEMGAAGNIGRVEAAYTEALRAHSGDYTCQFSFPKESAYRRLLTIAGFAVEQMETFELPLPLPGGRGGLRQAAEALFARSLALYRDDTRAAILDDFECAAEEEGLWDGSVWVADGVHLRFAARKVRQAAAPGGASPLAVLGS